MQAVIISAGESSRFWPLNKEHKAATRLLGHPLLYWTIKGLAENGVKEVIVVCSPKSQIPEILSRENDFGISLKFAFQEKPLGTGNALSQARGFIRETFFVVWPNKVNSKEIAENMLQEKKSGIHAVLTGAETATPWDYGIARFEGQRIVEIKENPEPGKEPSNIKILGFFLFEPNFFEYYDRLPKHHEADLIDAINLYLKDKKATLLQIEKDVPALKYPWELFGILDILFHSKYFKVGIAPSAQIGKNVILKGQVFIGQNSIIKDNTIIEGPCYIGNNCEIGYSNVIRGPVSIEDNVKTGAFFEIKHSIIQTGTHFHSGYVGDSIVGRECRFGAGFITANRRLDRKNIKAKIKGKEVDTGTSYFGTAIGDGTRFGIQTGTMPGVLVGADCIIGPGVLIFENIPDNSKVFVKK